MWWIELFSWIRKPRADSQGCIDQAYTMASRMIWLKGLSAETANNRFRTDACFARVGYLNLYAGNQNDKD